MLDSTVPKFHPFAARVAALALLGLAIAGCAAGAGTAATLAVLLSFGALALSGCSSSHGRGDASTGELDGGGIDASAIDAGGTWEPCCVDGVIETCLCPPDAICNYGWFVECPDGTCSLGACEIVDAGAPADAGGDWEPCCEDGVIETCFCPADAECNYGLFHDCGDGTCVHPGLMCPAP